MSARIRVLLVGLLGAFSLTGFPRLGTSHSSTYYLHKESGSNFGSFAFSTASLHAGTLVRQSGDMKGRSTVPPDATSGSVVVNVAGQQSNPAACSVIMPPVIEALAPRSGTIGQEVTISGQHFGSVGPIAPTVTFNGIPATISSWNQTTIVANVPIGAASGPVVVTNPAASPCPGCPIIHSQASNGELFVVGRLVRILSVTPSPVQAHTPTPVTITARVDVHPTLLPSTVSLYELQPGTHQPVLLASMGDDGTHGDALKGDNVFTAVTSVNRPSAVVLLQAAASYSHLPEPAFSEVVRLVVQEASTPAQTLASAATLIEQNDIEGALAYFAASETRAEALRQLNAQQRARVVSFFRSLVLIREDGDVRVYHGPWLTTGGETTQIEVGLTRNELGRWVIFTW